MNDSANTIDAQGPPVYSEVNQRVPRYGKAEGEERMSVSDDEYRVRFHIFCRQWGLEPQEEPQPEEIPEDLSHDIYSLPPRPGGGSMISRRRRQVRRPAKRHD